MKRGGWFAVCSVLSPPLLSVASLISAGEPPPPASNSGVPIASIQEMLSAGKFTDAAMVAERMLADKSVENPKARELATYYLGYSKFSAGDYFAAGRALSQLAPFGQDFGLHAQYLLARSHHLSGERPEAFAGYQALIADLEQRKKNTPDAFKTPLDFAARAIFYSGQLLSEDGKFAEALGVFSAQIQQYPSTPATEEAKLRAGFCHLQNRNFAEALKLLEPLQKNPQVGDRAAWWLSRAQLGAADPNNAQTYAPAVKSALDSLNRALALNAELAKKDAGAKARSNEILFELGDTQQTAKQFAEAAATYHKVASSSEIPDQIQQALQRQAVALQLTGKFKESDELCEKFEKDYAKSPLLPEILFRAAENAWMSAGDDSAKLDEAISRYQKLLDRFPEFQYVNIARAGLASAQYKKKLYADAIKTLSAIADADRSGDLMGVNYLHADCLIQLLPSEASNAFEAVQLMDRADLAAKLLDKFATAMGKSPKAAEPMLKLGECLSRIAELTASPQEKQQTLSRARQTFDKLLQEFINEPAAPLAIIERAQVIAMQGDINGAINELNRFTQDPQKQKPVAPLALIKMAGLLRAQNRAADALNLMTRCKQQYEATLTADAKRKGWLVLMQYEHAMALKETGKSKEAVAMLENGAETPMLVLAAAKTRREDFSKTAQTANINEFRKFADEFKGKAEKYQSKEFGRATSAYLRAALEAGLCYSAIADLEIRDALANLKLAPNADIPATVPVSASEKLAQEQFEAVLSIEPRALIADEVRVMLAESKARRGQHDAALELLMTALENSPPQELLDKVHHGMAASLLAKDDAKTALSHTQAILKNQSTRIGNEARQLEEKIRQKIK